MNQRTISVLALAAVGLSAVLLSGCPNTPNTTPTAARLHMVWKGVDDDDGIYHAYFTSNPSSEGWTSQNRIEGVGTSNSPAITAFSYADVPTNPGNPPIGVFTAWKGIPGDQGLYWARKFNAQTNIPDVGTSSGPAMAAQPFQYVYLAWKGVQGDSGIYWSYNNLFQGGGGWAPQEMVPNVGTSDRPALAFHRPLLYMAWKGIDGDSGIYFSTNDGGARWQPQRRVSDVGSSAGPALAFFHQALHMAWKGIPDDSGIYHSTSFNNGVSWTPQQRIPDVGTSQSPALAVYNDRLFLAWKGIEGDSGLYWSASADGVTWRAQENVPGVGSSNGPSLAEE